MSELESLFAAFAGALGKDPAGDMDDRWRAAVVNAKLAHADGSLTTAGRFVLALERQPGRVAVAAVEIAIDAAANEPDAKHLRWLLSDAPGPASNESSARMAACDHLTGCRVPGVAFAPLLGVLYLAVASADGARKVYRRPHTGFDRNRQITLAVEAVELARVVLIQVDHDTAANFEAEILEALARPQ